MANIESEVPDSKTEKEKPKLPEYRCITEDCGATMKRHVVKIHTEDVPLPTDRLFCPVCSESTTVSNWHEHFGVPMLDELVTA